MKIRNFIKKIAGSHKKAMTAAVVTAIAVAIPVSVWAAWGPSRPTFNWNNPSQRVGSMTGPVFNSFINTPTYGDERNLTTIAPSGNTNWRDQVNAQPGDTVDVRVYVHNNANESTNASGKGIAKNTNVRIYLPEGVANGFDIGGYISADNATPKRVYDTANVSTSGQPFSLAYVPGSAKIYNHSNWKNGHSLSDSVVSANGAKIGYNSLNGELPGCFDYTVTVIIKVKIVAPELELEKKVTNPGSTDWQKTKVVKPGDTVSWLLDFTNVGNGTISKVTLRDPIPAGMKLVPGSITWVDSANPNGKVLPDNALSGGVNLGNYAAKGGGYIRFRTTIDKDFDFNKVDCKLTNIGYARADYIKEISSSAYVRVDVNKNGNPDDDCKEKPPEPQKPKYACDLLEVERGKNRSAKFTTSASASGGATIERYRYNFGDGTEELVTDRSIVEHRYAQDGQYVASVKVEVRVDGEIKIAESQSCVVKVNFDTPSTPPEVPEQPGQPGVPTTLVETGPGDVIAIFAAVTLAGTVAYHIVATRRSLG